MVGEVLFMLVMVEVVRLLIIYLEEHRVAVDFMIELGIVSTLREVVLRGVTELAWTQVRSDRFSRGARHAAPLRRSPGVRSAQHRARVAVSGRKSARVVQGAQCREAWDTPAGREDEAGCAFQGADGR